MSLSALVTSFLQDIHQGGRSLLRSSPGFTAVAVATLALGIGGNTAIFSVVDAVLLRDLPYPDAGRLASVWSVAPSGGPGGYSEPALLEARRRNRVFERLTGWAVAAFNITGQDLPERVDGLRVNWDFFKTLGVSPVLGRDFAPEDDRPGAPLAAIISHGLWQRSFGGDPGIAGRSIVLDGRQTTVIGVMPSSFRFFRAPEMWVPLALNPGSTRGAIYLGAIGRLKPGMTLAQAAAQWGAPVQPMRALTRRKEPKELLVLFGAVGLVLLIACANVANLLLARSFCRRRELAVRVSLGAGRGRLLQQLLTEAGMLAAAGGLLGVLLAAWVVQVLAALVPPILASGCSPIEVNWRALAFTGGLSLLTALVFGGLPAWRASRPDPVSQLHQGIRGGGRGAGAARLRRLLVAAEVALSFMLLTGAGLLIRSFAAMRSVDLGFRPDNVLALRLSATPGRNQPPAALNAAYRRILAEAASIPGVDSAGLSLGLSPWGTPMARMFDIPGRPPASSSEVRGAAFEAVSPGYFRTVGITLRQGRVFQESDDQNSQPVAIVNEKFVRQYLPDEEAIGRRLVLMTANPAAPPPAAVIVGVVSDVRFGGPTANGVQMIYVPILQSPVADAALVLRTTGSPAALLPAVRLALARIDRDTPASQATTLDQIVTASVAQPRAHTWLMTVFGAVALALAALGIYGMVSEAVFGRRHEIGVRLALGATTAGISGLVVREAMLWVGGGALAGLAGSLALTRSIKSLLFLVEASDLRTHAAVFLILVVCALPAVVFPLRRLNNMNPAACLRIE